MRAAVGEALSAASASRLPRLLFGGVETPERESAEPAPPDLVLAEAAKLPSTTLYWLLVPSPRGYTVAEHRTAQRIARGSVIALDGVSYRVAVVAPSPFRDGRRCAYLEPPA